MRNEDEFLESELFGGLDQLKSIICYLNNQNKSFNLLIYMTVSIQFFIFVLLYWASLYCAQNASIRWAWSITYIHSHLFSIKMQGIPAIAKDFF